MQDPHHTYPDVFLSKGINSSFLFLMLRKNTVSIYDRLFYTPTCHRGVLWNVERRTDTGKHRHFNNILYLRNDRYGITDYPIKRLMFA